MYVATAAIVTSDAIGKLVQFVDFELLDPPGLDPSFALVLGLVPCLSSFPSPPSTSVGISLCWQRWSL
jgi:hypothetical protein